MPELNPTEFSQSERLALYKLLVEQTNVNGATRRDSARFFLTFNTGAFTLLGLAVSNHWIDGVLKDTSLFVRVALAAMALLMTLVSVLWLLLIRYYGRIATAKFEAILEVEKKFEIQPYRMESERLWTPKTRWFSATTIESSIPIIFAAGYAALALLALLRA